MQKPDSFQNKIRVFQRTQMERLHLYKAILQQGDFIYLATDSILHKGCRYLWSPLCCTSILRPLSFILVAPALEVFKNLPAYKDARPCKYECVTLRPDDEANDWEKPAYFSAFKEFVENEKKRSYICPSLQVINHPIDEESKETSTADEWNNISEQQAIQQAVFSKHKDFTQIVISQDVNFLQGLHKLCNSIPGQSSLTTLMLNDDGYLVDPFDTTESDLMSKVATGKLASLVEAAPLFVDDSALKHRNAPDFLNNVKPTLLNANTHLSVLAFKNEALPLSDLLIARAQETPSTIKFFWLSDKFQKTEALINAILTQGKSHIILITDRVSRAEKIQSRVASSGIRIDIYSINQYGFLSCRDGSQGQKKGSEKYQETTQRKRMEDAVKAGNLMAVQSLGTDANTWETGIMTAFCHNAHHILEALVNQGDFISPHLIRWIITEFRQFQNPSYLEENPKIYEILVKILSKTRSVPAYFAEEIYEHLCGLNDAPHASHVELEFLIQLFKDAIENAFGTILRKARFSRALLKQELPRTVLSPQKALEIKRQSINAKQEQIRAQIRELEQQLAQLEKEEAAIDAELHSTTKTNKKRK